MNPRIHPAKLQIAVDAAQLLFICGSILTRQLNSRTRVEVREDPQEPATSSHVSLTANPLPCCSPSPPWQGAPRRHRWRGRWPRHLHRGPIPLGPGALQPSPGLAASRIRCKNERRCSLRQYESAAARMPMPRTSKSVRATSAVESSRARSGARERNRCGS